MHTPKVYYDTKNACYALLLIGPVITTYTQSLEYLRNLHLMHMQHVH